MATLAPEKYDFFGYFTYKNGKMTGLSLYGSDKDSIRKQQ